MIRIAAVLALVLAATATAQTGGSQQTVRQVKPNLFVVEGAGGNTTLWVSNHGLILVDDKIAGAENFDNLVAAVRSVSDLPVRAVFNTHRHFDHVGNNAAFLAAGVLVIGTDTLATDLARQDKAAPNLVFSRDFSLILDTGRADAHHYRAGHTADDAIVVFPSVHAVALGGLVVSGTPTFDFESGANLAGWVATLEDILQLDVDIGIPGRGKPVTRADIAAFRDSLVTFQARSVAAVQRGVPQSKLIAAVRVDDLGWAWSPAAWPPARVAGLWRESGGK